MKIEFSYSGACFSIFMKMLTLVVLKERRKPPLISRSLYSIKKKGNHKNIQYLHKLLKNNI